jgi:acetoin utilization deacetylase AcuC-like enzyme
MKTAFLCDERVFWHAGGNYAFTLPAGDLVQPMAGGLPENPETKRRLRNLIEVTGLLRELDATGADPATTEDLRRVHPADYLARFKALSAGLAIEALARVLTGRARNAYALTRPPGHHCLPDRPNGFCLLANGAIAIEAARAHAPGLRVAVIDWDVHHGNGTEAIYAADPDVLTISLHQDRNYPTDTGHASVRGEGAGLGANLNIPLPPGTGHRGYLAAFERLVIPALTRFRPDAILVACGYDAAAVDPLGRMLATAETFAQLARRTLDAADHLCGGRVAMLHEGGYSEAYVPFCGHAVLAEMAGSAIAAPDPLAATLAARQPDARFDAMINAHLSDLEGFFGLR